LIVARFALELLSARRAGPDYEFVDGNFSLNV